MTHVRHILEELDERRMELGMPLGVLARQSGLGVDTVQRVLRRKGGERLETILKIAKNTGNIGNK